MNRSYTKRELQDLDTIEQAWDGDELKVERAKSGWLEKQANSKYKTVRQ